MSTSSWPAARSAIAPPSRSAEARAQAPASRPAEAHAQALASYAAEARAEALASLAALERLRAEWEALWAQVPQASPLQHPAWLLPWWRHVGCGTLAAVAVRSEAGELVAFAPLYVYAEGDRRWLFPLGMATTDDLTPLVRPGWQAQAAHCIGQHIAGLDGLHALECPQQRRGSVLLELACAPGWQQAACACEPHPVLDLRDPQAIPKAMRDNVRHCRSRAERAGAVVVQTAGPRQLEEFLAALERLHARRWAARGEAGVLHDPAVRAMHREAAPQLQAAGLLRLHALRVDGAIVAVLQCLQHARRCHYYIGGFDPAHAAISPGTLLVAHAIEQARAEACTAFDFLRGREAYKYRWGAVDEPRFALRRWRGSR